MSIANWRKDEQPREKLLLKGASALSDAELLAIFLRTGVKGINAVELARRLLQNYGSLRQLLESSQEQFCQNCGLGIAKYVQLQAVLEMNRRHLHQELEQGCTMDNPDTVRDYLTVQLRHYEREVFACLFLDNKHRVLGFDVLFKG